MRKNNNTIRAMTQLVRVTHHAAPRRAEEVAEGVLTRAVHLESDCSSFDVHGRTVWPKGVIYRRFRSATHGG